MPCTTILVGKNVSYDGSTMIARNDDGHFDVKKMIVVNPKDQPKKYTSKNGHLTIDLPNNPLRYTSCPNVDLSNGVWPANGINELNVAMTATETITTNPRVMACDPYVEYVKGSGKNKDVPGGIGEEDLVLLILPYIRSAREGVLRLGALLEQYGTYESNGVAFSDEREIWWLETIGGHHYIARRVDDNEVVIMPNQFGLDRFDFDDAFGRQESNLCSKDLREFIEDNHLSLQIGGAFNPRLVFGSYSDSDHVYNTPRAWYMARYFCPNSYRWDGEDADFTPESDNIPWALRPEHKVSVEDVKYILSSYFQGTDYNPYGKSNLAGKYRSIGINRTSVMAILQIRPYIMGDNKAVEWLCFGSNAFNSALPMYCGVSSLPDFVSKTPLEVDTNYFYWLSRLIEVMADNQYGACIQLIERYQKSVANRGHQIIYEYDKKMIDGYDEKLCLEANEKLAKMAKREASKVLKEVLMVLENSMRNGYRRADK